jgi:3-phosphoshikimate 1-carboxyvinyltransferase
MQIKISSPASLHATVQLPSSKSISNRVLIMHALGRGADMPENLSDCDDTQVMIAALREAGETLDIKAAGTAMRFLTAYRAITPGTKVITGTQRMQQRPIRLLVDALRSLGAQVEYLANEGFPPLRITGGSLEGREVTLQGSVSSQYISALLMIAPMLPEGMTLHLTGEIVSRPYIDLTLQLMGQFGAQAAWSDDHTIRVEAKPYQSIPFYVESDWSAASYWYEMVALSKEAEVTLNGLFADSLQGDAAVAKIFEQLGVATEYGDKQVTLRKTGKVVERLEVDFVNQPDLAQTFVVTCALLGVPFRFTGLQSLKIKETDRIAALRRELAKLGYDVREENDSVLYWEGARVEADALPQIDTYEDHRMAMAFAPAALLLPELRINEPQVVSKSYPHYWDDLRAAGFVIANV